MIMISDSYLMNVAWVGWRIIFKRKVISKITNFCTKFYAQNRCCHGMAVFFRRLYRSWTSRQDPTSTGQYRLPGASLFFTIWLHMVMIFYDFARTWTMTWRIGVLLISKSDISTYFRPSASDLARNPKFRFASIRLVPCVLSESVCIWPEQNRVLVDDRSPPNRLKALRKSTHSLEDLQIPDLFFPDSLKFRKIRVFQSTQCLLQIAKRHGHAWKTRTPSGAGRFRT